MNYELDMPEIKGKAAAISAFIGMAFVFCPAIGVIVNSVNNSIAQDRFNVFKDSAAAAMAPDVNQMHIFIADDKKFSEKVAEFNKNHPTAKIDRYTMSNENGYTLDIYVPYQDELARVDRRETLVY